MNYYKLVDPDGVTLDVIKGICPPGYIETTKEVFDNFTPPNLNVDFGIVGQPNEEIEI